MGIWKETEFYTPYLLFLEETESYVRDYENSGQTAGLWLNWTPSSLDHNTNAFNRYTDMELGATLCIVSARLGLNSLEIIDFILGFVGIDIAKDDPEKEYKEKPTR